ncbi:hypothetical protein C2G38_2029002 [Gigaspora rosea]|uniref:Saposin B-type domain-containing protein n=1 Tax=Gigaspora rosea TaxID=44941 RepID=A0A397W1C6_9GLOM|nr:hypothetical protein C2G38_2029002 [Gigaspora rosea]
MRFLYFLFPILATFTIIVRAQNDIYEIFDDELTCEKLFNVDFCSDCQELIFKDFQQEENDCPTYFKLSKDVIKEIKKSGETKIDPYDLTYLKKGLEDYCDQPFNCDPDTAKEYWSKIEHVCAKELSGKTDWSNDPTKIDKTKLMVYDTFLTYYFGIPDHHGLCYKYSDSDEYCMFKIYRNFMEYAKNVTNGDPNVTLSADLKYVIKKDGSKVPVPKKAFCGEKCFETEAKIYISWIKECKLSPELSEEVFYGSEKDFIDFLSCKTEDKRNIIRRTSEFYLSPIRSLAGFLN